IGLETLARQWHRRDVFATFALASAAMAAAVVTLWFQHVPGPAASAVRDRSLIWPAALAGLCVLSSLVSGLTRLRSRLPARARALPARARALPAWALWLGGVLFLLFAGIGINSYAKTPFPSTAAIARLKHLTGKSLIGLDGGNGTNVQEFVPVGFYPEVNVGYGIAEFAGHDPVILKRYFAVLSPQAPNGGSGYLQPDIDSLAMARRYGVSYVLASSSTPKLKGAALVAKIAGERLYSVPDSSRFTLSGNGGSVAVRHRTPDEYDLTTPALAKKEVLTARLTPLPGWHASVDGRPVRLVDPRLGASPSTLTYQISVPAGRHHVRLWYWPDRLDVGIAAAGVAAGAFLAFWLGTALTRRRRRPPGHRPRRREAGREAASDAFSITFGD
ncbi:MAG: hypothetical protein ACRDZ5_11925, partial [Acidimicrobiales bacterium]